MVKTAFLTASAPLTPRSMEKTSARPRHRALAATSPDSFG
jgi:hypothetical protein